MRIGVSLLPCRERVIGRHVVKLSLSWWEAVELASGDLGQQFPYEVEQCWDIDRLFNERAHLGCLGQFALVGHAREQDNRQERIDLKQPIDTGPAISEGHVQVRQDQVKLVRVRQEPVHGFFPVHGQNDLVLLSLQELAQRFAHGQIVVRQEYCRSHLSLRLRKAVLLAARSADLKRPVFPFAPAGQVVAEDLLVLFHQIQTLAPGVKGKFKSVGKCVVGHDVHRPCLSSSLTALSVGPPAGNGAELQLAFAPFQTPEFMGFNLVLQILGGLEKRGFERVVSGLGVQGWVHYFISCWQVWFRPVAPARQLSGRRRSYSIGLVRAFQVIGANSGAIPAWYLLAGFVPVRVQRSVR